MTERDDSMILVPKSKWASFAAGVCLALFLVQALVLNSRLLRNYAVDAKPNSNSSGASSHVSCNISSPRMEIHANASNTVKKDVLPTNRNGRHIIFYHFHQAMFVKDLVDCILINCVLLYKTENREGVSSQCCWLIPRALLDYAE